MKLWLKQTLVFFLMLCISGGMLTGAYFLTKPKPIIPEDPFNGVPALTQEVLELAYDSEAYTRFVLTDRTVTKEENDIVATVTHAYKTDDGAMLIHIEITGLVEGETDKIIIAIKDGEVVHFVILSTENEDYLNEFGITTGERFTAYYTDIAVAAGDTPVKTALVTAAELAQDLTEDLLNKPSFDTPGLARNKLEAGYDSTTYTRLAIEGLTLVKADGAGAATVTITVTHAYQMDDGAILVHMTCVGNRYISTPTTAAEKQEVIVVIKDNAFIHLVLLKTLGSGGQFTTFLANTGIKVGIDKANRFTNYEIIVSQSTATSTKRSLITAVALATEIEESLTA